MLIPASQVRPGNSVLDPVSGKRRKVREVMPHVHNPNANDTGRALIGMVWWRVTGADTIWVVDSESMWEVS